jgi:hypothetical protein
MKFARCYEVQETQEVQTVTCDDHIAAEACISEVSMSRLVLLIGLIKLDHTCMYVMCS